MARDIAANILLVDDRKANLLALKAILEAPGLDIFTASSGNEALGLMLDHEFAVVLLDVQMPDMDGFEVVELMRKREKTKFVPVIFVTAINKEKKYIFKGYESGAVDYLFKPLDPVILKGKINIFLELHRKNMELEMSWEKIQRQNKRLKEVAIRDGLTGLYNHRYFQEILAREFLLAQRSSSDITCFMIDLDYFKDVSDTFGHAFGDFVLQNFAGLIREASRKTDVLARYGGEEFVLLLPNTGLEGARVLAEKFRQLAESYTYQMNGYNRRVTASIGISSFFSHRPGSPADLVGFADKALYHAKAGGRNQVRVFRESDATVKIPRKGHSQETLFGLRERLKNMLENTRASILFSLQSLTMQSQRSTLNRRTQNDERNEYLNQRKIELVDQLGERLGLSRPLVQTFKRAAILHDFFKAYLGDDTAQKQDPLSRQEEPDIEDYPFMLEELTRTFDVFADERMILRYHHECYDGSGYPEGLKGAEVPIGARLFALVDAFVAMTSNRYYRPNLTHREVVDELVGLAGYMFDPLLVGILLDIAGEKNLLKVPQKLLAEAKEQLSRIPGG